MSSLSARRDARPVLIRFLLVVGLVAVNAAIGLRYQRLPLTLVLAAAGGELPECLGQDPPPAAKLEKCGILPATQSRTVTGREAVKGLEAAARAGRGGDAR